MSLHWLFETSNRFTRIHRMDLISKIMLFCAICDGESVFFFCKQTHHSCLALRVAALSIHLSRRLLHVLLRLIPVLHPASVELCSGPVAFGRPAHGAVALRDVARLLGQLILINEAALLLTGFLRVGPRLFLPRCKDPIKHHAPVVHEGSNEEDILPLFPGLETESRCSQDESLLNGSDDVLKYFFHS